MRTLLGAILAAASCLGGALRSAAADAPDFRPPFDKGDYRGTVAIQANPWFPLYKPPMHALGGPNTAYLKPKTADWWGEGMKLCREYGVTMLTPEINEPSAWTGCWRAMLDSAKKNGVPVKIGMFFGMYSKDKDAVIASMKRVLGPFREDLKSSPAVARAGGCPVMVVYNPKKFKPEVWGEVFAALDAEFGRMAYLMNVGEFAHMAAQGGGGSARVDERFERLLRDYLPYCDGISSYGNGMRVPFSVVRKVMGEYPGKINEGQAHFTYCNHFHMGGAPGDLTKTWRDNLDACLSTDPDSVMLTNLFDHYENSLIYPCYDREDFLLRYLEYMLEKWKGRPFRRETSPELVVANFAAALVGWRDLKFEVLGFPISNRVADVEVSLDVCDTSGKVLHTFPSRKMRLDAFRAESFTVPSTRFAGERGVVPRLRYRWAGRERAMNFGPMTVMEPSILGYRMFWARSTRNQLAVDGPNDWRMDDAAPGGTHQPRRLGLTRFSAALNPVYQGAAKNLLGASRYGIRRDGQEFYFQDDAKGFNCDFVLPTPSPGSALHWYHLEVHNGEGRKYQTLPVWETNGRRAAKVKVPVWKADGSIAEYDIEGSRVPFWYYPMLEDGGRVLLDMSGWGHNGAVRGSGYGGGHLGHTGYNHYHNGPVPSTFGGKFRSLFRRDEDGRGYLSFNGSNDYVMVMGGTAFPGAFTYELSVRPAELGREVGLISTAYNNQIQIWLMVDGSVKVAHQSEHESVEGGRKVARQRVDSLRSDAKLAPGRWAKLAVTYDLRRLALYVDGAPAGSVSSPPSRQAETINHVVIGAKCGGLWNPTANFRGDIRAVRMYGRNLSPDEFL